jgi:hypothetical protein
MYSRVVEKSSLRQAYPCLMESTTPYGLIVLFTEKQVGVVLVNAGRGGPVVGTYARDWGPDAFKPFEGNVILSNNGFGV